MTRKELLILMENYLEALIEKCPQKITCSSKCRIMYNGKKSEIGDNPLWKNTLVIRQRQTFVDEVEGNIVFFGVMTNEPFEKVYPFPVDINVHNVTYTATIRIHVENGEIVEIEELVSDKRMRNFYYEAKDISLPDLEFEILVPEDERSTREELKELVETYWNCIERKDSAEKLKIHPDAQRYENGYCTTNHTYSFRGDFKYNEGFCWDTPENSRCYPIIDTKRGLVVSYCMLEGNSNTADGDQGVRVVEAFKIKDGLLCHLMAFFPILKEFCIY